uniref:Carcinoembryonic antigen-related cell adhesion molecule 6-like n=1 Tax=Marmota marmota marmota TaxID=9994 RepID=A0A8C5ZRM0_MARMA
MEPPSASPHRGHVPWQGLLLAVLVSPLTFWNLPTTAQLAIESVPFTAAEGTDVLLLAHNVSENVKGYTWYKGERGIDSHQISIYLTATQGIIPGPAYSGRETVYPNGSLLFQKVTLEDTGFYTLQTISSDLQAEKASGHISSGSSMHTVSVTCQKLCASPRHSPGSPTSSEPSDPPASAQDTHSCLVLQDSGWWEVRGQLRWKDTFAGTKGTTGQSSLCGLQSRDAQTPPTLCDLCTKIIFFPSIKMALFSLSICSTVTLKRSGETQGTALSCSWS